jgi:hypothetical protein
MRFKARKDTKNPVEATAKNKREISFSLTSINTSFSNEAS